MTQRSLLVTYGDTPAAITAAIERITTVREIDQFMAQQDKELQRQFDEGNVVRAQHGAPPRPKRILLPEKSILTLEREWAKAQKEIWGFPDSLDALVEGYREYKKRKDSVT